MSEKLIRNIRLIDKATFEDYYLAIAKNIEDSLVEAGATPGEDYTIIDLYTLAQPFVLDQFKENKIDIAIEW